MLYSVDLALGNDQTDEDWNERQAAMKPSSAPLTVPGFRTAQRFKGVGLSPPPYLALYTIDFADVLTSNAYRNIGGGGLTAARWKPRSPCGTATCLTAPAPCRWWLKPQRCLSKTRSPPMKQMPGRYSHGGGAGLDVPPLIAAWPLWFVRGVDRARRDEWRSGVPANRTTDDGLGRRLELNLRRNADWSISC